MLNQNKERAFINRCMAKGQSKREIWTNCNRWSNRSKKSEMERKKLTEKQYKEKYNFLFNVVKILDYEI